MQEKRYCLIGGYELILKDDTLFLEHAKSFYLNGSRSIDYFDHRIVTNKGKLGGDQVKMGRNRMSYSITLKVNCEDGLVDELKSFFKSSSFKEMGIGNIVRCSLVDKLEDRMVLEAGLIGADNLVVDSFEFNEENVILDSSGKPIEISCNLKTEVEYFRKNSFIFSDRLYDMFRGAGVLENDALKLIDECNLKILRNNAIPSYNKTLFFENQKGDSFLLKLNKVPIEGKVEALCNFYLGKGLLAERVPGCPNLNANLEGDGNNAYLISIQNDVCDKIIPGAYVSLEAFSDFVARLYVVGRNNAKDVWANGKRMMDIIPVEGEYVFEEMLDVAGIGFSDYEKRLLSKKADDYGINEIVNCGCSSVSEGFRKSNLFSLIHPDLKKDNLFVKKDGSLMGIDLTLTYGNIAKACAIYVAQNNLGDFQILEMVEDIATKIRSYSNKEMELSVSDRQDLFYQTRILARGLAAPKEIGGLTERYDLNPKKLGVERDQLVHYVKTNLF